MGLSYQPKAITLSFKEGKPVTYKAQQVTYPTIKSKDLLAYAANAANKIAEEVITTCDNPFCVYSNLPNVICYWNSAL